MNSGNTSNDVNKIKLAVLHQNSGLGLQQDFDDEYCSFAAVNPSQNQITGDPVWIENLIKVKKICVENIFTLSLYWYQSYKNAQSPVEWLQAKNGPYCLERNGGKMERSVDYINNESVIVNFASLTMKRTLPSSVQKKNVKR